MTSITLCIAVHLITAIVVSGHNPNFNQNACGINENYSPCTQLCPPTCDNQNPRCRVDCSRGSCTCIPGHVYNGGRCIPANTCYAPQPVNRCRSHIDCPRGSNCIDGICRAAASGVYTQTVITSSASSSSSHHHHHSHHKDCTLDIHCPYKSICINGNCVLTTDLNRLANSCVFSSDCPLGARCVNQVCR